MTYSSEDKGWLGGRRARHQILARIHYRAVVGSSLALVLITSRTSAQSPFSPRPTAAADSLEVVRSVADRLWATQEAQLSPGIRIQAADALTYQALDSQSRARGLTLDPPPPAGTKPGRACPFRMPADTAGLNKTAGPDGYVVALVISELKDASATAGYYIGCGAGAAPLSANLEAARFRLKRWKTHWVIDETLFHWVT